MPALDDLLRDLGPRVLGVVARDQDFGDAEDAVQEALLAAHRQWPAEGTPANPAGWLVRVARRRLVDAVRSDLARSDRERDWEARTARLAEAAEVGPVDDSLEVLVLCCHRALTPASALALTLRAVGGLTTAEVARALLVDEATVAQRISRAKRRIRETGGRLEPPTAEELPARLAHVLQVVYLMFNEGYLASAGPELDRPDLVAEAVRIGRMLRSALPEEPEVAGLLALMLLADARRPARTDAAGALVPLAEQDRGRWRRAELAEGLALTHEALAGGAAGGYGVQAAIAAVHSEAPSAAETDWPQILGLYDVLLRLQPGPVVRLNRAVAVAMVHGAEDALREVEAVAPALAATGSAHRVESVRAHLLAMAGDHGAAAGAFAAAADEAPPGPEREHLRRRAAGADPRGGS